jgi:protein TonB
VFVFDSRIKTTFVALAMTPALFAEVRVPTGDALKAALTKPSPEYSAVARQMKVTGHVEVEATVGTDGAVEAVKVLTGNPLLTNSTVNAVKKWKFTPFMENGAPAKAVAVLSFDFKP